MRKAARTVKPNARTGERHTWKDRERRRKEERQRMAAEALIYCTKAQKIEIELEFEFYRNVFYEELSTFMDAFIQAQKIFPEDAPVGDYDEFNERDMKIAFMATGIERRSRAAMIEESEAGNEKTKTTDS
jgi:phosphate-selective porin